MNFEPAPGRPSEKRLKLRYAGICRLCSAGISAKTDAIYERDTKTVRCLECPGAGEAQQDQIVVSATELVAAAADEFLSDVSVAGASARREYERRKARDDVRLREKWGRFGGIAASLADEKQSTTVWERGAVGEEKVGARLDALAGDDLAVLHDRRVPGSRANIDHLAITRSGIWVVDAKRYKGQRPELKVEGGILRPRVEKVLVGRRDCTKLVDGVLRQVDLVRDVVGDLPVRGALCFVESDWPLIGGAFTTREVHVVWAKRLARLLSLEGSGEVDVAAAHAMLARHFPPA